LKKTDYNKNSKFHEVIVVEGMHDLSAIKDIYPNADVIITNGSEISKETLQELELLNKKRGLILFMDPDMQGERIRKAINQVVGPTKHAHVKKSDAISKNKKKVGVEHASETNIKEALNNALSMMDNDNPSLELVDLYELQLIGHKNAKSLRKELGESLGIGFNNGKTLYKKLCMFGISKQDIINTLRR